MAFPTAVNDQITDSVTQANVKVVGDAPAIATSNFYIATSQALSNAAHNATTQQQQAYVTSQAALTTGINTLYSLDTASSAMTAAQLMQRSSRAVVGSTPRTKRAVTAEHVIGFIHTLLDSPQGRAQLKEAVRQAQESTVNSDTEANLKTVQTTLERAIREALDAGVTKQTVCYTLHQVAHDLNINMTYPALDAPDLSVPMIEEYYEAMIAAYQAEG